MTSVTEDTGTLSTGNEAVNQLIQNINWGLYSNYVSTPTDCPQRDEWLGWTADAQSFSVAAGYFTKAKEFLRNYLLSMRDAQRDDGAYRSVSPYGRYGNNYGATGWADAGVIRAADQAQEELQLNNAAAAIQMAGDLNQDGVINTADVVLLMQYLNRWKGSVLAEQADLNRDGKIGIADAIWLMRRIAS